MASTSTSSGGVHSGAFPAARAVAAGACRMCGTPDLHPSGEVEGFAFVECARCGLVFTPQVTPELLDSLYRSGWHGPDEGAPATGWAVDEGEFLDPAFDILGRDRPLSILDFGTGQSHVPDSLRARGHRVQAIDVAPPLRPHPDRLTGSLFDVDLPSQAFDLVYAYQVFEHLPEPRPFLERLLALLRPGGILLVHTDMEMPEREAGFMRWWYVLPPDHCTFYRHRTWDVFLEDRPERVVWRDPKTVVVQAPAKNA